MWRTHIFFTFMAEISFRIFTHIFEAWQLINSYQPRHMVDKPRFVEASQFYGNNIWEARRITFCCWNTVFAINPFPKEADASRVVHQDGSVYFCWCATLAVSPSVNNIATSFELFTADLYGGREKKEAKQPRFFGEKKCKYASLAHGTVVFGVKIKQLAWKMWEQSLPFSNKPQANMVHRFCTREEYSLLY